MREANMLQAYEILELYLELLAVRAELLAKTREIPPDMVEVGAGAWRGCGRVQQCRPCTQGRCQRRGRGAATTPAGAGAAALPFTRPYTPTRPAGHLVADLRRGAGGH